MFKKKQAKNIETLLSDEEIKRVTRDLRRISLPFVFITDAEHGKPKIKTKCLWGVQWSAQHTVYRFPKIKYRFRVLIATPFAGSSLVYFAEKDCFFLMRKISDKPVRFESPFKNAMFSMRGRFLRLQQHLHHRLPNQQAMAVCLMYLGKEFL